MSPGSSKARFALRNRNPTGVIITLDIGVADPYDPLTLWILGTQFLADQLLQIEITEGGVVTSEPL